MKPGYRRGKEYAEDARKILKAKGIAIPDINKIPSWVSQSIEKKANKYGNAELNLLIYLDVSIYDKLDLNQVRNACRKYASCFHSIWVLRDGLFAKLFSKSAFMDFNENWMEISERIEQFIGG